MKIDFNKQQVRIPLLPVAAGLLIAGGLYLSLRLGRIDASDVGVLVNNVTGTVSVRTEPGSFFYNSLYTDLYTVNKTLRTLKMRAEVGEQVKIKTVEGADVKLDVEVNYQLLLDEDTIASKVVPESGVEKFAPTRRRGRGATEEQLEAYQHKWIRDYSRSVIRYVFGTLATEQFYDAGMRNTKARECEQELNRLLNPHGINVPLVVADKFTFYDAYERKIREKQEAIQEVEEQQVAAKNALEEQKKEEVEATKAAEVEVATIKGTLEKDLIAAQAEAIKVKKSAEAYEYTAKVEAAAAFYQAQRQAKGILVAAQAEAQSLTKLVAALDGEGGRNLVLRALAKALRKAEIEGVPYATSPVVQRVSVENAAAAAKEGKR